MFWAPTKERVKSHDSKEQNKRCRKCFLCKSMCFCPSCSKCPQCCRNSGCRGKTAKPLEEMVKPRGKSKGGIHFERGLHASLQNEAPSYKVTSGSEWLCKSGQEPTFKRGIASSNTKVGGGKRGCLVLPGLLQPVILSTKTQQQVETNLGSKSVKSFPLSRNFQGGDSGNNSVVPAKRGVGNLVGFQRCLLPHPNPSKVKKVSEILPERSDFSIHCSSFWPSHSSFGVHKGGQGGQTHGTSEGYPDPPVPRRLVTESPVPRNLPTSYPDPLGPLPRVRVSGKHEEIRVDTTAGLQFRRLPF